MRATDRTLPPGRTHRSPSPSTHYRLDGEVSTAQDWLPARSAGEFEQLQGPRGDVVDAIRKLRDQPDGHVPKIGVGGSFSRTLLETASSVHP
ncbi:MAG TPA: hypothetical protein VF082_00265 [Jiangellaceae bacterium]